MIPDLSLFWDFSAETWDINNQEVAVLCRDDNNNSLYENGENIGNMPKGEIPGFPCLIVKNNERMKISNANTRSGEVSYEFASDAFDGTKKAQTRHYDVDNALEQTEDLNKYISKGNDITPVIVKAWEEFKNVNNACQRDYIYYGIDKTNTPGTLNKNIREQLYRFRINANAFGKIADADIDPKLNTVTEEKRYLTNEEILQRIWTDGRFEFRFKSHIASTDSKASMESDVIISVRAKDVFSIEKVHLHHKNSTMFRRSKNTYTVDINNLRSKWIYPKALETNVSNQVFTLPWDICKQSLSLHLFVEEFDLSQTIETTKTVTNEYTVKTDFSAESSQTSGDNKTTAKTSHGFSSTTTDINTVKVTTAVGSDNLGTLSFFFYDPIIRAESNGTYRLYDVSSGDITATILPTNVIATK